ncbi:T9SS type B sorting domain-containing protein [Flavobacterium weaverense]|uniref:Gliding motility-associated-like protein n=1 Tax=Flavobacterium weaverense TaxID=271156 RepID=A0A3L9ZZB8_9FLAO|nr:T9SS type B sorting domain-containing protein [Flavobacterium weaverense]RMA78221.1 gliding motility-associated-like protein [Flavobacterium weaverense]
MKKTLLLLLVFLSMNSFAQLSKTHYIPPLATAAYTTGSTVTQSSVYPNNQYLYISTPSTSYVNFTIELLGLGTSRIINGTVKLNEPYRLDFPNPLDLSSGNFTQILLNRDQIHTVLNSKGIIIEAAEPVFAAIRLTAGISSSAVTSTPNSNQASGLISKGLAGLGKKFRIGAFTNKGTSTGSLNYLTFASILATKNNTRIDFSDIKPGVTLINGATFGNTPPFITLQRGESFVIAVICNTAANRDGLIGGLIEASEPIAVNCGSFGGTNGTGSGMDLGFDQIVPVENMLGLDYIFIKGNGATNLETILLVAHEGVPGNETKIFLNGNTGTEDFKLLAGESIQISGYSYSLNNNLYVRSDKKIFAFQSIGGGSGEPNQEMYFVPPLSCQTPRTIKHIPEIEEIGGLNFTTDTRVNLVTKTGSNLNFNINGIDYQTIASLSSATIIVNGPLPIIGNTNYVTYTLIGSGLRGNVSAESTSELYLSYFASSGNATFGGYYSGFTLEPDISYYNPTSTISNCIKNGVPVTLKTSVNSGYDTFEWFNEAGVLVGTSATFSTSIPGYYYVSATNSLCTNGPKVSDRIPVSLCAADDDDDDVNNNVDVDHDNDGISNCTESFANSSIDLTNHINGTITVGTYLNSFSGNVNTAGIGAAPPTPVTGYNDGNFTTETAAIKNNSTSYKVNFTKPLSVAIEYTNNSSLSLLTTNTEYHITCPVTKTLTILNPDDQLLIDTNYDGIFESGITQFSSYDIRFRLKSTIPLNPGTGSFKILGNLLNEITITNKNLDELNSSKSTLRMLTTCVPKDSDGDGITDDLDTDSDNDGIRDTIEAQGNNSVPISNSDTNKNGLDNAFEPGFTPLDTDGDGIPDYLDLDSDNDGILDSVETASDLDGDGIGNYRDLDSDADLCLDVIEAGFLNPNNNGLLGSSPITVDVNGKVTSALGYTIPNPNYLLAAPIGISVQPQATPTCHLQNTTITITDNADSYQWQLSIDGVNWNNISNDLTYSGATTNMLAITGVKNSVNGYKYRVQPNRIGNGCGLISNETTLTVYPLPIINSPIVLKQCDDDIDGQTTFNLTQKNNFISADPTFTFTYFENNSDAINGAGPSKITNPTAFTNTTPFNQTIYVRVENNNGCATIGNIELKISTTTIPSTFNRSFSICDDLTAATNSDYDGSSVFDFHSVTNDIRTTFLTGTIPYSISYYRNESDALSEINPLNQTFPSDPNDPTNIYNYRNIGYPNSQQIWVRVDSDIDNACFGLGPYITLTVEKLPIANPVSIPRQCDDNQDGIYVFDTSTLETTLLGTNQSFPVTVKYFDSSNNPLKDSNGVLIASPFPSTFSTTSQIIKAVVTNTTALQCYDETTIVFTVDDLPQAFPIATNLTTTCDDEADPLLQDGKYSFDTSTFQNTILGSQTAMIVNYFDENGVALPSPLPNPFVTGSQNVTAIVVNPINPSCNSSVILPFFVNPLPRINLNSDGNENELVCSNLPTFFVTLTAGIQDGSPATDYNYIWSKDGVVLPDTTPTLIVNSEGDYTVEVSTLLGCSSTRNLKVTASDIATITTIDIVDFTDINSVTVNVSGQGLYEYSLDDPSGPYQTSNVFNNVPSGIHDVYVNDINGCGTVSKTISVIGVPKFFTPNNDTYNDYWKVQGINASFNPNSTIYIFDRYGKLLKQLNPLTQGWDGTFNGVPLPSDDYWYTIKLEDGRQAKGHFSLKR